MVIENGAAANKPAGDFKGGAKDLSADEFGHDDDCGGGRTAGGVVGNRRRL